MGRALECVVLRAPDPEGDWELDFSGPSPLALRRYDGAVRAGFEENGSPGLTVSGRAHACNEVNGWFEIGALPRGSIGALRIRFFQLCDDVSAPLTGEIDLRPLP